MTSKKKGQQLTKYCRIFQWVEAQDEALAGAVRDLCMEGALSAGRRGGGGVTFLYPKDASYRKEIIAKAYSDDAEEAVRLIESLIISDVLRTAADFRRGAGSRLGIKLAVEDVTGDTVTLAGGAKLKPATSFRPLHRDNLAVWIVESGRVPTEGEAYEAPKRSRGGYTGGTGNGNGLLSEGGLSSRATLSVATEAAYDQCMRKDRCRTRNPYLAHAVSLLNFLKGKHPDILVWLLPIIDRDPAVTFYLLVEPYKTTAPYLLPDNILFGPDGWNGAEVYQGAVSEFSGFFESLDTNTIKSAEDPSSGSPMVPYVYQDPGSIRSEVDIIRLQILGPDGRKGNKITTPKNVREVYELLVSRNMIGGRGPILPDDTVRNLPGEKKLWQDELRFIVHAALEELQNAPIYSTEQYADIVRMLRDQRPGNNYDAEASLSNMELLQQNVSPQAEYLLLLKFINSSDFLYIPVSSAKVGGQWGNIPVVTTPEAFRDPRELSIYNTEPSKQRRLATWSAMDVPRGLGASCIAELRNYVMVHGRLPPELGIVEGGPGGPPATSVRSEPPPGSSGS